MGLFDTEDDDRQNMGILAMMTGLGTLQANQPGSSTGQAFGAGGMQGLQGLMQMRQMNQRDRQLKANQEYQNAMLQQAQQRMVPNSVREYEYAKQNGFNGSFDEYRNQVMGRNEVPANIREWEAFNQLSEADQARYLTMKRSNPYQNFGGFMALPNQAAPGQFQAVVEKTPPPEQMPAFKGDQSRQQAAGKVQGETQATAAVNLPQTIAQGEEAIKLVDDLINHPGMKDVVGLPESASGIATRVIGTPIPGTAAADFKARLDQIGGKQFLQAFETLKGGGQITEVEGKKATDAISRLMQTGQTEEEYKKAAEEFKSVIRAGLNRAKMKAGVSAGGASGGWSIQRVD